MKEKAYLFRCKDSHKIKVDYCGTLYTMKEKRMSKVREDLKEQGIITELKE